MSARSASASAVRACAVLALALLSCLAGRSSAGAQAEPSESTATDGGGSAADPALHPKSAADAIGFSDVDTGSGQNDADGDAAAPAGLDGNALERADPVSTLHAGATLRLQSAVRVQRSEPSRLAKLRQVSDLWLEWRAAVGSATLRLRGALWTEADFAVLSNRSQYDRPTVDTYAWQARPGESYVALDWSILSLSVGTQVVNLGAGEVLSVLDVVNPRDLREPLLTDAGDLRLPVLMSRAGISYQRVTAEVLAVHDAWFGLLPPPLGEFSPFRKLLLEVPAFAAALSNRSLEYEHRPGRTLSPTATQAYARLRWTGESVDLSLIGGTLLDLLGVPTIPEPAAFEREPVALPVHHPRYAMIGHAGTTTLGAFIVRWELALELQRPFAMRDDSLVLPAWQSLRENSAAELAGVTFVPSTHTSAAIEVTARQWLRRGPKLETLRLLYPLLEPRFALRFHHQFWSDRASFDVLALIFGASPLNAWAARAELGYALADGIEVSIGYVTYQPSDHFGFLHGFEAHDRAYLNLRCAFGSD